MNNQNTTSSGSDQQIKELLQQQARKTRRALFISAVGLTLFLVVALVFPFRDELLSYLYPKPATVAVPVPEKTTEEEIKYAPGELIIKFTGDAGKILDQKLSSSKLALSSNDLTNTGISSLDTLNQKHNVTSMTPVFKSLKKKQLETKKTYLELIQEIKDKFPKRTARASQNAQPSNLLNIYRLELQDKKAYIPTTFQEYQKDPNIEYAEPNYVYETTVTPTDEYFSQQWAHQKIQSEQAWDIETGSENVVIAIVDTGVDWNHPDLADNIWLNDDEIPDNGTDDDGNGYIDDVRGWDFVDVPSEYLSQCAPGEDCTERDDDPIDFHGHGTHCSGIAAAVTNNGTGIAGTCWYCQIMSVRAGWKTITGRGALFYEDCSHALVYAADNGADVISMSWGGYSTSQLIQDAVRYAYSQGALLVAAAGNESSYATSYPAGYEEVIAVAATDEDDRKASFSNYGDWIAVVAPGVNIKSTLFDDAYESWSGTSMACPHVSGLAGLVISQYPALTNPEIVARIIYAADNIDSLNPGYEGLLGNGRINAYRTLTVEPEPLLEVVAISKDTFLGPGKTVDISATLRNRGAAVHNIVGTLSSPSPYVSIVSDTASFGDLDCLETSTNEDPFTIHLRDDTPAQVTIDFLLHLEADECTLDYEFELDTTSHYEWTIILEGVNSRNAPLVADLDKDGKKEIVVALTGQNFYDRSQGRIDVVDYQGTVLWSVDPVPGVDNMVSAIAMGDINNDGFLEVVAGVPVRPPGDEGDWTEGALIRLFAYNYLGDLLTDYPVDVGDALYPWVYLSLSDINSDNQLDIVTSYYSDSFRGIVSAYNSRGQNLWTADVGGASFSPLAIGDVDNDGKMEIGLGTGGEGLHLLKSDGTSMPSWPVEVGPVFDQTPVTMGDVDNDGDLEIISSAWREGHGLYVYHHTGERLLFVPKTYPDIYIRAEAALADLDGDEDLEILIPTFIRDEDPSAGKVDAYHHDGTPVSGWSVPYFGWVEEGEQVNLAIGDIDTDGDSEVLLGTYTVGYSSIPQKDRYCGFINAWHDDGAPIIGFPLKYPRELAGLENGSLVITDLDSDGFVDLIVLRCEEANNPTPKSYLSVINLNGEYNPTGMEWPMFHHNLQHTGNYHFTLLPTPTPTLRPTSTPVPPTPTPLPPTPTPIPQPDLSVGNIGHSGSTIYYTVKNQGDADAGWSWSVLLVDFVHVGSDFVKPLPVGKISIQGFASYTWTCSGASDVISICVDATNRVTESNENNNCRSVILPCPTP